MLSYGTYLGIFIGVTAGSFIIYMVFILLVPIRDYAMFLKALFNIEMKVTGSGASAVYTVDIYDQGNRYKRIRKVSLDFSVFS